MPVKLKTAERETTINRQAVRDVVTSTITKSRSADRAVPGTKPRKDLTAKASKSAVKSQ